MPTPRENLETAIREALKAGDRIRLATLRLLLTAVDNERIRTGRDVDEESFLRLVQRAIKQRRDSVEQYRKGGREDLASAEEAEAAILASYLPPPVDEAELEDAVRAFVTEHELGGATALGQVMKEMLSRYSGRADGGTINRVARKILTEASE